MNEPKISTKPLDSSSRRNSLLSPAFQGLLWVNFLTAMNDNIFRWFVIGIGKKIVPPEESASVLAWGLGAFVLPYLLLAVTAGWLADRFQKRKVIIGCKIAEIFVMVLGMIAVSSGNLYFLYFTVFCMGAQSALFAPSKVGTIPELLDENKISTGNGWFNLTSLTATIIGMLVGAYLADLTGVAGNENLWIAATVVIGMAIIGTLVSLMIHSMPAANPKLKHPWNIIAATWRDLRELAVDSRLFRVAIGIAFFWSFASLGQLNIDVYAMESGSRMEMERLPLLVSLILGVGGGSILAGVASRGRIELGLVPWGTIGMILFSILLCLSPSHFIDGTLGQMGLFWACFLLFSLGISAGFFDVPLAAYIQHHSPVEKRGQILAANNFMLFGAMLLISVLFQTLGSPAHEGTLANLRPEWAGTNLTQAERESVDSIRSQFEADRSSQSDSQNRWINYLPAEDDQLYFPIAATLMHSDMLQVKSELLDKAEKEGTVPAKFSEQPYIDAWVGEVESSDGVMTPLEDKKRRLITHVNRQAAKTPWLNSRQIFLFMALIAIPVLVYSTLKTRRNALRIAVYWFIKTLYRFEIKGLENIPEKGSAVVIANHQSWLDAVIMMMLVNRKMRTIAWAGNFTFPPLKWLAKFADVILISGGPKSIRKGLQEARDALDRGELVCLFPEGGISKTTQIRKFKPGINKILDDDHKHIPVIPVYLDEIWGTAPSFSQNRFFFKWPRSFRHNVTMHVGKPIQLPESIHLLRQQMQEMGADIVSERQGPFVSPPQKFIRECKRRKFKFKIGDSMGQSATGGSLLMRAIILKRLMERHGICDEENIGVLIPPTVGGVIVNVALALAKKVSVNLNYSVGNDILNEIIAQAGIKKILSTRKVMEKFDFELNAEIVYLDDFKDKVTLGDKLAGVIGSYITPAGMLESSFGLKNTDPDQVLTLVFTSGSTGIPKGVMLTHGNIENNIDGINRVAKLRKDDVMVGILPFFHSFGYTVTMWGVIGNECAGCYHFNPLDAKQVGKLVKKYGGTMLLATPTFLRTYTRRCSVEEFESLNLVVAGAERLPPELSDSFEKKFGVRPVEGYGATELSPLVSVNIPKSRQDDEWQIDIKEGTVGRTIPHVATKVTDLDTGEVLDAEQEGMLWIKGPNVMKGYLKRPDLTSEVLVDGWYKTGDVALVDKDGFIKITGRISRFSKIGGEMVPHVKIEEVLMQQIGDDDEEPNIAVTAVPDEKKGERLIVLHTEIPKSPSELRQGLSDAGLANIFIPSEDSFIRVEQLPVLGSGKIDLKGLKKMAEDLAGK